ncbi:MAG: site-specific DNA-methyltransferase, partial [Clostridiales bacterium]|nr:site-specific DNA-methyltransferase [Clostridiales bacterium]
SGTTGHAVMKLNAEDGGNRKFILCTNNENNICRDVTYERIKRIIEKEDYKASLKYMKVDFVPISDKLYYEYADELLKHIKELVELENGINFDGNKELAIILTEEELDNFTNNISNECKTIYLGHDVLPTEEQEKLFKKHKIKVNIIPDYYYRDLEG